VPGGRVAPGAVWLEARHLPIDRFHLGARSPRLGLTALEPPPISVAWYLAPTAATALALCTLALLKRRPLWRARPRPKVAAGLDASRPRLLRSLLQPSNYSLDGRVCDAVTGRPLPGARLSIHANGQALELTADERGGFAVPSLPAGPLIVQIAAPGYVRERFERVVPHRGELCDVRVLLSPIRARIFAAYRRAAAPLLPDRALADTWTPREILRHAMSARAHHLDELGVLTALVEEACYSARRPELSTLAEAERLASQLVGASRP
jgi:hypothetical protein